ncbi:MAG: hypothetical protein HYZ14_13385 [Bacteroidetes bacterium]|nr:hypothetical protein [Bacteroidota bacterium]
MTLSNAILQLLKREKTPLSIHEITSILNEKKEHQKKDRSPISDKEVRFVTGRLGLLFNISGNLVDLHPNEKISGTYTMEWIDHARIRPSMYLGSEKNDAIALIFCSIAQIAIEFTGSTDLFVKIVVKKNNLFNLSLESNTTLHEFVPRIFSGKFEKKFYAASMLTPVADKLTIHLGKKSFRYSFGDKPLTITSRDAKHCKRLTMEISFDKAVIEDVDIDYWVLSGKMSDVAILNWGVKILLQDERPEYAQQNFFHFPEGIFYLFEQQKATLFRSLDYEFYFDGKIKNNSYQIALGYRSDWSPEPTTAGYANNRTMNHQSNLIKGIMEGLLTAVKKYAAKVFPEHLEEYKQNQTISVLQQILLADMPKKDVPQFIFSKKKIMNGLILIAAVRGSDEIVVPKESGWQEIDQIRTDVKKEIADQFLNFLINNKKEALKFMWRFDKTQLGSAMF